MEEDRKCTFSQAIGVLKAEKPFDPVTVSLVEKGIEFGRVPIEIYLNYVAIPGDINAVTDEDCRKFGFIPTPPKY